MKEIALAGLMMTVEEWQSLDGAARAEIVAAVMQWDSPTLLCAVPETGIPSIEDEGELARGSSPAIAIPDREITMPDKITATSGTGQ